MDVIQADMWQSIFDEPEFLRNRYSGNSYDGQFEHGDSLVESENDRLTDELKGKIGTLKSFAIEIGGEVRDQNNLLYGMDDEFDGAGGFLGKAMHRVRGLRKGSQNSVLLYLVLFALFVFFIIWIIIRF